MASTFLLDPTTWDLVVDASGNIAVATEPYSQAQDAASYIRLFQGELWYDTTKGIPYWSQILGKFPPPALLKAYFVQAAVLVPDVTKARAFVTSFKNRKVTGQVQIESVQGTSVAAF